MDLAVLSSCNRALAAIHSFIALAFATALMFLAFVANSDLFACHRYQDLILTAFLYCAKLLFGSKRQSARFCGNTLISWPVKWNNGIILLSQNFQLGPSFDAKMFYAIVEVVSGIIVE